MGFQNEKILEDSYPNICPYCGEKINPSKISENYRGMFASNSEYETVFMCNSKECSRYFATTYKIGVYNQTPEILNTYRIHFTEDKIFSDNINSLSKKFEKIYNEALVCEENKLLEIAGMGYRKSAEFLLKDFLLSNEGLSKEDKDKIKTHSSLIYLVKEYLENEKIINIAEKCSWFGNDQTHYHVKHGDKDLQDLKKTLDILVHFIDMEISYEDYSKVLSKK